MDVQQPSTNWDAHNLNSEWTKFKDHATLMFHGPLAGKTEKVQCAYLLIWVGERGREIFKTFDMLVAEVDKIAVYIKKFKDYAAPKHSQVFSHSVFQKREQLKTESVDRFITKLKILVKACGYSEESEMIWDKIICGVKNTKICEKLLAEGGQLTLERAITICLTCETTQAQLKIFEEKQEIKQETDSISRNWKKASSQKSKELFLLWAI